MGKPEEPEPLSAPEWIVTFSDVISLLVTFFVLILTFSTLEIEKLEKIKGNLVGGYGFMGKPFESNRSEILNRDTADANRLRERGAKMAFARDVEELNLELENVKLKTRKEIELDIRRIQGGMRIRLRADRMFEPGTGVLRSRYEGVVEELGRVLKYYPNEIVVEGHTDNRFTGDVMEGRPSPYPKGYEMSGAMARSVVAVLTGRGEVPPRRVRIASFGPSRPIVTNATPEGRARNRRVDILVLAENPASEED